jgi:osmotically-inducible protein OsmY
VKGLANTIRVKPAAPKAADVAELVSSAIERMAHLDARSVSVTTTNGTVHLHGMCIRSPRSMQQAGRPNPRRV